jgi:hypothetical protein
MKMGRDNRNLMSDMLPNCYPVQWRHRMKVFGHGSTGFQLSLSYVFAWTGSFKASFLVRIPIVVLELDGGGDNESRLSQYIVFVATAA